MSSRFVALVLGAVTVAACRDTTVPPRGQLEPQVLESPPPAPAGPLRGKSVAFLATDGFSQPDLVMPRLMLAEQGANTFVVGPRPGTIQGYNQLEKRDRVKVDVTLEEANAKTFDGLVLPGGLASTDALRTDPRAVQLVRQMAESKRVVATMCHGPWLLVEAGAVRDRTMTSCPSLKTDLLNAGAVWVDRPVQADEGIVTARRSEDIEAFVKKTAEELLEPPRKHAER